VNVLLGLARFAFLALLIFFLLYITWLIRRDMD
jgi:cbb3-type cytochrome oxidase subunit 3